MNEKKRKYANVVPTSSVVHFAGAAIVGYLRRIRDERIRELNKQKGRKKQKVTFCFYIWQLLERTEANLKK